MNNNKIIILLGLLGFIVMADNWVVSPILPAIAESLGIPVENAGILISAYMDPLWDFPDHLRPFDHPVLQFETEFCGNSTLLCRNVYREKRNGRGLKGS